MQLQPPPKAIFNSMLIYKTYILTFYLVNQKVRYKELVFKAQFNRTESFLVGGHESSCSSFKPMGHLDKCSIQIFHGKCEHTFICLWAYKITHTCNFTTQFKYKEMDSHSQAWGIKKEAIPLGNGRIKHRFLCGIIHLAWCSCEDIKTPSVP